MRSKMPGIYLSFRTTFSILNPQRMILKFFQRVTKPSLSLFLLLKSVLFFRVECLELDVCSFNVGAILLSRLDFAVLRAHHLEQYQWKRS